MRVTAIECQNCHSIIFSRATHDFRNCECGRTYVDGGFEYLKLGFDPKDEYPKFYSLEIDAKKTDLYYDYNLHLKKDKYGLYKNLEALKRRKYFKSITELKDSEEKEVEKTRNRFDGIEI